jgi:hypothetical protein
MVNERRIRYGVAFVMVLILAWAGMTTITALAFWKVSDRSLNEGMPWLSLWVFTVLAPTTAAFRLHRRLNELVAARTDVPDRIIQDLANMRWAFLVFGSMAGLAAMLLIVSP